MNTEVVDILRHSIIENNTVKLNCGQLNRDLYNRVDTVLSRLWGKWEGKRKLHSFSYDPTDAINQYCSTGVLPPKNELAYFPTPDVIIDDIIDSIDYSTFENVLEPSAGQGAIALRLREAFKIENLDMVEYSKLNAEILRSKNIGNVYEMDFLTFEPTCSYDLIVMNPPFSVSGNSKAYIDHILKAYSFLNKHGTLISVVPASFEFNSDMKSLRFRNFVNSRNRTVYVYDSKEFKSSGTSISTRLISFYPEYQLQELKYRFITRLSLYYDGSYGIEYYRETHKNKTAEEYVDYILYLSTNFYEGIPLEYRDEYISYVKQFDKEQDL